MSLVLFFHRPAVEDDVSMITPRTLKGFRDYLPAVMIPREAMMQTAREVFRSFG